MNMKDRSSASDTKMTNHCTLVVFQDADDTLTQKRDVTDKEISRRLTETLPCQELTPWFKSEGRPSLPTNMKITSETDKIELSSQSRRQFIINASKCAIAENHLETYFTWAATNAPITDLYSSMKKVGFLPVIPHLVTNCSTVYSALRNFEDMRKQLGEQSFPVISDKGVYQVIMDIILISSIQIPKFISNGRHFPHGKSCLTLSREIFEREWH